MNEGVLNKHFLSKQEDAESHERDMESLLTNW